MLIIGCDFHTRYQQIAMMDEATGELVERRLEHENGEAHSFYRNLPQPVRVGVEATGPLHWFERLLGELGHELWIGNSAKIRASEVRKQKTDERDARLILELLLAKRFSAHLGSHSRRTGPPATALASSQDGADAHDAGQSASFSGHEPGAV
ncbi:MAG: IS110 family transposase, partial [Candidatus Acidiferrales bacterium]